MKRHLLLIGRQPIGSLNFLPVAMTLSGYDLITNRKARIKLNEVAKDFVASTGRGGNKTTV
ncbi:MAG: hypothetical protein U5K76_09195 [Woeseiaceae bacterium]|nr:hypothetical protein [Woeseiaceae bacterium]